IVRVEVEFLALQAVRLVEQLERAGARVEARQAVVRAQPEAIRAVGLDSPHDLAGQVDPAGLALEANLLGCRGAAYDMIETATGGADPHLPTTVDMHGIDRVVAETRAIVVILLVVEEAARRSLQEIEAAANRPDPEVATGVFRDGTGSGIAE